MTDKVSNPQWDHAPLSFEQQLQMKEIRTWRDEFIDSCKRLGSSRELSLAITNMQQAAFWALTHIGGEQ